MASCTHTVHPALVAFDAELGSSCSEVSLLNRTLQASCSHYIAPGVLSVVGVNAQCTCYHLLTKWQEPTR